MVNGTARGSDFLQLAVADVPDGGKAEWLAGRLRAAIADGRLPVGGRLPPTRVLAAELRVSRGVVTEAYRRLAEDGQVTGRRRAGTIVVAAPFTNTAPTGPGAGFDVGDADGHAYGLGASGADGPGVGDASRHADGLDVDSAGRHANPLGTDGADGPRAQDAKGHVEGLGGGDTDGTGVGAAGRHATPLGTGGADGLGHDGTLGGHPGGATDRGPAGPTHDTSPYLSPARTVNGVPGHQCPTGPIHATPEHESLAPIDGVPARSRPAGPFEGVPGHQRPAGPTHDTPPYLGPARPVNGVPGHQRPAGLTHATPAYQSPARSINGAPGHQCPAEPAHDTPAYHSPARPIRNAPAHRNLAEPVHSTPAHRSPAGPPHATPAAPDTAGPLFGEVPGAGVFDALRAAPAVVDFTPGRPDLTVFPRAAWLRAERAVLAESAADHLGYGDPRGAPRLRRAVADWLARMRGVRVDPESVLIVAGTAQALTLLHPVLRADGVDAVAVEDPGSLGARQHLANGGLATPPVPVDEHGVRVDALRATGARAVLLTPAHQFPTGVVTSGERRRELLEWARAGGLILEDDYDAEHRYDRPPVPALRALLADRVCYLGSASKLLAPALRIGWLVAPDRYRSALIEAKRFNDLGNAVLPQLVLARLMESGALERHLRLVRGRHRRRRDAMIAALAGQLPGAVVHGAAAGLHLTVTYPGDVPDAEFAAAALAHGVKCHPLSWHRQSPGPPGLVLGYAAGSPGVIADGVARLGRALRSLS
ncbi:aminotransferase class I/II-fold pyridoxal phosphate-dependent enzyme [Streptomyces sp. CSDS2]|uniref:aminotransferase class I/II-fold pyridoxal phosphate-dependent enzyme n=1 Tax=Streptomyces sp. CSDS2 TaxID=3055051 RepID=UPI00339D4B34